MLALAGIKVVYPPVFAHLPRLFCIMSASCQGPYFHEMVSKIPQQVYGVPSEASISVRCCLGAAAKTGSV